MTKTKIFAVMLASLACAALLGSCDYWKEDYYKNGGDSGSQASGTATLVVQASGGSTGGSSGSSGSSGGSSGATSSYTMNAEEQSVFNSLVGSWKDDDNEIYTIHSNGTIDSSERGTATWSKARVKSAALNDLSDYGSSDEDNFFGIIEAGCYYEGVWFDDSFGHRIFRESDGTYKISDYTRL